MSDETGLQLALEYAVTACNAGKVKRRGGEPISTSFCPRKFARMAYRRLHNWRAVADALGHSKAYWMLIAKGERRMSRADENALRRRLWLPPKGITKIERMRTGDLAEYIRNRRTVSP